MHHHIQTVCLCLWILIYFITSDPQTYLSLSLTIYSWNYLFLANMFVLYIYMMCTCMYVCVGVWTHGHAKAHVRRSDNFSCLFCLRQGLSFAFCCCIHQASGPWVSEDSPSLPPILSEGHWDMCSYTQLSHGFWDSNSEIYACTPSALSTEPSFLASSGTC